jgi:hypothetical protein
MVARRAARQPHDIGVRSHGLKLVRVVDWVQRREQNVGLPAGGPPTPTWIVLQPARLLAFSDFGALFNRQPKATTTPVVVSSSSLLWLRPEAASVYRGLQSSGRLIGQWQAQ